MFGGNGQQNRNYEPGSGIDLGKTAQSGSMAQNTGGIAANTNAATGSQTQTNNQFTPRSMQAINGAASRGWLNAKSFERIVLDAAKQALIDPNLIVGLAARESGLFPGAKIGDAKGIMQITPARQSDLHIRNQDIMDVRTQVNAAAKALATAMHTFHGNTDLAIASWTVGVDGTKRAYRAHGMEGVRNLLLDRKHPGYGRVGPQYVDYVKQYLP